MGNEFFDYVQPLASIWLAVGDQYQVILFNGRF